MDDRGDSHDDVPLGFALGAATRKLAKFYASALADGPVTPAQLALLRQLWQEDGQQLRLLAQRAHLDATSATWLVNQLAAGDFLERRRTDADRRIVRVWLTVAGQRLRAALEPEMARWEEAIAETLAAHHPAEEIATFRAVLTTIIAAFPEGGDLWAARSALWDARLNALKAFVEADAARESSEEHSRE